MDQIVGDGILLKLHPVTHPSHAGDKINRSLEHYPKPLQIIKIQYSTSPGPDYPLRGSHSYSRHSQKRLIIGSVDFYRKAFQMAHRPVTLRVQKHIEIRTLRGQKL